MKFNNSSRSVEFNLGDAANNQKAAAKSGATSRRELKIDIERAQNGVEVQKKVGKKQNSKENLSDACLDGTVGSFSVVRNDFTSRYLDDTETKHFRNEPHWTQDECENARKFRFIVAFMALIGLLLCLTSRMVLNVGIVEMSKSDTPDEQATTMTGTTIFCDNETTTSQAYDLTETTFVLETTSSTPETSTFYPELSSEFSEKRNEVGIESTGKPVETVDTVNSDSDDAPYKIEWTPSRKNYLIASFYMGYAPSMMFTGGLANKYGSFWPLFIGVFVSFLINAVTPFITSFSYSLLFVSRLILGVCQGCVMPAIYDVFNRWLTMTETSIFVPMLKLSFGIGSLLGSALPALTKALGYDWPYLFYETSFLCGIWSIGWFFLATSTPQTNKFVEPNELHRIMRKKMKKPEPKRVSKGENYQLSVITRKTYMQEDLNKLRENRPEAQAKEPSRDDSKEDTPWLLIAMNRSVLGLALTKFTYNMGADFVCLELPMYLDKVHKKPIETISKLCSFGFLIQIIFSLGVGWLAKYAVENKLFGLSKSKWRKAFQGFSNFGMSICYFILAFCGPSFFAIVVILELVFFLWIFGAGGESIVAYDLSVKYPATITGFAHSIGITSSFVLPAVCDYILQQDDTNNERWETIFKLVGFLCLLGGLVFVFLVRPKPFLPGEVEDKRKVSNSK